MFVDLNADCGESFGDFKVGNDKELLKIITSANIACGFHAGDFNIIAKTIDLALQNKVAIGAHPGFPDLQNFGRREMNFSANEIYNLVLYQIGAISAFATAKNAKIQHIKPHGALYNLSAKNQEIAKAIAKAVYDFDKNLILFGLANSISLIEAEKLGLKTVSEVFADRTYQDDGSLTKRTEQNAIIHNEKQVLEQVLMMVKEKKVKTLSGKLLDIKAQSICLHGDNLEAVQFAKVLREKLESENITLSNFSYE